MRKMYMFSMCAWCIHVCANLRVCVACVCLCLNVCVCGDVVCFDRPCGCKHKPSGLLPPDAFINY